MENPLISCIIPVYNGERYLKEAVDSILAQTYRNAEIIIVDDGSTDGTSQVIAHLREKVRYVSQPNTGAPTARNLGLNLAKGEFVAFLDSDDLWHPQKLERQIARFKARQELDLCVTHLRNFWISELQEEKQRFEHHRLAEALPGYVTVTLLARRVLFGTVGLFDTALKVGDSKDWFLRAAERRVVMELLPDVLVYRRMHRDNMSMKPGSRQMTPSMQDAVLRVVKASLDRRRENDTHPSPLKFSDLSQQKNLRLARPCNTLTGSPVCFPKSKNSDTF